MKYGNVPGVELPVSRLVQGTVMISSDRLGESLALLDGAYELGCNAFDTAHTYGGGDNERMVGRWIRERGIRDKVVVIGKGAHPMEGKNRVTPQNIESDLNESLSRFGFDCIDLYLLHRDDESVPVGEILCTLNQQVAAGLIRAFGGSNWSHRRIEEANSYARSHGMVPFAASSPQFSLAVPQKPVWEGCVSISGDKPAQKYYADAGLAVFSWSSLGGGWFSGRFTRTNLHSFDGYFDKLCADCYGNEENFRRLERAQELAKTNGATPAQIALAWLMKQPLNLFALVGSSNRSEFLDNLRGLDIELSDDEAAWLG